MSPKNEVVKVIHLKNLKAGYVVNGSRKNVDNYINIGPPAITAVIANGRVYCSSPTYSEGEKCSWTPLVTSAMVAPGAIKMTVDGRKLHVDCLRLYEDENEDLHVGTEKVISFDIDEPDSIMTEKAKIMNLFVDATFTYHSGKKLKYEEFTKLNVSSDIPMQPGTLYRSDSELLAYLGGNYGKTWRITQAGGLKFSNYELTRKDYEYKWDREAQQDVLDHVDTHNFTLINDPENYMQIIILFK